MPLKSFIDVSPESHFPLENLPFGVFQPAEGDPRVGVAIGEMILDLTTLEEMGELCELGEDPVFGGRSLNRFMSMGRLFWKKTRQFVQQLLAADNPTLRDNADLRAGVLHRQKDATMLLPAEIGDYTDFYSSYHHAHNVGTMLRGPENALMPNWKWLPVAYHGRASSIVVSGTPVRRPQGQIKPPEAAAPIFSPSRAFDFELEMAFFIGPGNKLGESVPIEHAEEHIFGFVLMNDWSARDIQTWEYQPLGPFLAKNFCTTISPWVVMLEALEPFRKTTSSQDPEPLSYLKRERDFTFDIQLEARLQTAKLKQPHVITCTNFQNLYWSVAQQIAHHTIGGCNLRPADLLASGTISGPTEESRGCMLELTWRGANPIQLPNGETRKWLEDGDTLAITGWCQGNGYRIGFGEATGKVLATTG